MKSPIELLALLKNEGVRKELPKGQALLRQGEVSGNAFLVESGCLRLWYNDSENDISVKFYLAGDIVSALDSFYLERPSNFGIESIVPTVVRVFSRRDFLDHMENTPHFKDYMLTVAVHCMADYQNLFVDRIQNNPEKRYRCLVAEHPELLEIVPQHFIASYLGVTPVSLSRIRKKVETINNC